MNKIINYIKENCIAFLIIIIIVLLMIIFNPLLKSGTYSVSNSFLALNCPNTANVGEIVSCNIELIPNGEKIYSVNANYSFNNNIVFNSYDNSCTDCFEIYASNEKGFAVVKESGVSNNTLVGIIKVKISDKAVLGSKYTIKLTNVELVNAKDNDESDFGLIELSDIDANITIKDVEQEYYEFDSSLLVDRSNYPQNVLYNIKNGSTYNNLISKINGNYTITDNANNPIDISKIIKTGDIIVIKINGESILYELSIIGDLNKDGKIGLGDVTKLYDVYNKKTNITGALFYSSDLNNDDKISLGDVAKLYEMHNKIN